ncbi:hypothetical protein SDC9_131908 [bioreactor metagenome]|uniref:Uncharacterized protein n=1 Tax=bioreactor metagenome TaxID=1076179 RepID=A0A645D8A1_9ZZZZ
MFLAVPQLAVVILAVPSKLVPLIVLAVARLVAVLALPMRLPVKVGAVTFPVRVPPVRGK